MNDATAAEATIKARGWSIASPVDEFNRGPHGEVRILAIRSPDGAWIEFAEW